MDLKELGEFGLIQEIKKGITLPPGYVGIGDDCAVMPQEEGMETLVSTDMLVEGTHFLSDDISPYNLGWKSAAVNISDIAAMGGDCIGSFLSFALPKRISKEWIDEFFRGYKDVSSQFGCPLLGGDTTSSPDRLCISVTVLGRNHSGNSVRRCNARKDDLICVTGPLGDSACGLKIITEGCIRDDDAMYLIDRHYLPMPRIHEGKIAAKAGAHAMMDISDGIGSDLHHILDGSGLGAEIDTALIPVSDELCRKCLQYGWDATDLAVSGGEDYELLFTISEEDERKLQLKHHVIGMITEGKGIIWKGSDRDHSGYRHF